MALSRTLRARAVERHADRHGGLSLNLVSLIDILTTLVFFLLMTTAGVMTNINADGVALPSSVLKEVPRIGTQVVVSTHDIRVGDQVVESFDDALNDHAPELNRLAAALNSLRGGASGGAAAPIQAGSQNVNVVADRSVPFAVLRKVIATCAAWRGANHVSLALLQAH